MLPYPPFNCTIVSTLIMEMHSRIEKATVTKESKEKRDSQCNRSTPEQHHAFL